MCVVDVLQSLKFHQILRILLLLDVAKFFWLDNPLLASLTRILPTTLTTISKKIIFQARRMAIDKYIYKEEKIFLMRQNCVVACMAGKLDIYTYFSTHTPTRYTIEGDRNWWKRAAFIDTSVKKDYPGLVDAQARR